MAPDSNSFGCEILEKPQDLHAERFIWILQRGRCTYGKKAKNAQLSGAVAVIVVHDDPGANIEDLIPYADSHFHNLQTPILLIGRVDGTQLFEALKGYAQLIVSLRIEMKGVKSERAKAEFWLNPANVEAYDLMAKFGPVISKFGRKVDFEPKYKFEDFRRKKHHKGFLKKHCYMSGRYCATNSEHIEPLSILDEALRQICLWKNDPNPDKLLFWKYIAHYRVCLRKFEYDHKGVLDCYQDSYKLAGIASRLSAQIRQCVTNSFENPEFKTHGENRLLPTQDNPYIYSDIYLVPAFTINGELLKEELTDHSILRALCDELVSPPEVCGQFVFNGGRIKSMYHFQDSMAGLLFFCVLGSVLLVVFVMFWVRRALNKRVDRELFVEINQHVTNYMKISN